MHEGYQQHPSSDPVSTHCCRPGKPRARPNSDVTGHTSKPSGRGNGSGAMSGRARVQTTRAARRRQHIKQDMQTDERTSRTRVCPGRFRFPRGSRVGATVGGREPEEVPSNQTWKCSPSRRACTFRTALKAMSRSLVLSKRRAKLSLNTCAAREGKGREWGGAHAVHVLTPSSFEKDLSENQPAELPLSCPRL